MRQVVEIYQDRFDNGVCLGIAMGWIKEKLSTSNSVYKSKGRLFSSEARRFSTPSNPITLLKRGVSPSANSSLRRLTPERYKKTSAVRNEGAVLDGAHNQDIYRISGVAALSSHLRLGASDYTVSPKVRRGEGNVAERLHAESIAAAAQDLPKGEAILFEVEAMRDTGLVGHAVAFYKSAGDTLYFFDANAGVYEIPEYRRPVGRSGVSGLIEDLSDKLRSRGASADEQQAPKLATNTLHFVNDWLSVYKDSNQIDWQISRNAWYHGYSHIIGNAPEAEDNA